jgi:hypothetical protein
MFSSTTADENICTLSTIPVFKQLNNSQNSFCPSDVWIVLQYFHAVISKYKSRNKRFSDEDCFMAQLYFIVNVRIFPPNKWDKTNCDMDCIA